jgi:glyoxylase-like metal-dependent hydrolase (beta-lactamase superfamily II)
VWDALLRLQLFQEQKMGLTKVVDHVYAIPLGGVNAFVLDAEELVIVDTGTPGSAPKILQAIAELGRQPEEVTHILVTHAHADHFGGLAALKQATGANAVMHPLDAAMVRQGQTMRQVQPAPGLVNFIIYHLLIKRMKPTSVTPAEVDQEVEGGVELPIAGGITTVHLPGHSAGQIGFLWPQQGGVLFAGDVAANVMGLGFPPIFEDETAGRQSLAKVGNLACEVACFGHGKAITTGAAEKFRRKWGAGN